MSLSSLVCRSSWYCCIAYTSRARFSSAVSMACAISLWCASRAERSVSAVNARAAQYCSEADVAVKDLTVVTIAFFEGGDTIGARAYIMVRLSDTVEDGITEPCCVRGLLGEELDGA